MTEGKLFVISGPSGVGKGTICREIFSAESNTRFSVSMTTRPPREGEKEAVDYYFVTKEEFEKLLADGGLLEYNTFVDNYYGTPKEPVMEWLAAGCDVILEIDWHGAFQVRESYPESVLIFILPPSVEELKERIMCRGSETEESMQKRLEQAMSDIVQAERYDYRVVNDTLDNAVRQVCEIIKKERNKNVISINQ
ncbi:MAG: guanylate kinase [Lentihominibacter sp.]